MPDRYDPKLSVRPLSDRKPTDTRRDDDPLVELARLVSGRGPLEAPPAAPKPKPAQSATAADAPKTGGVDFGRNLEDELLSDLQASFSAIHETPLPPPLPPAPPLATGPAAPPAPAFGTATPAPQMRTEQLSAPPPAAPVQRTQPPPPRPSVAEAAPKPAAPLPPQRPASRIPVAERVEVANAPLRPTAPANPPPPAPPPQPAAEAASAPKLQPSRWEKPDAQKLPPADLSRFAPQSMRSAPQPPPPSAPELPDGFDEEAFGESLAFTEQPEGAEQEFQLEGFDMVPGYGDEDQLPPYPDEEGELAAMGRRTPSRGLIVVAGILAVALVGSLAMIIFRSGDADGSVPPIITADATPAKVQPEDTAGDEAADAQSKLIYDRVDSGEEAADTQLLTPADDPLADVEASGAGTDNPISRVIIPGGPGIDPPLDSGAAADATRETGDALSAAEELAAADAASESIGPRKVRTVIVRPDGTIVGNAASDEGTTPPVVETAPVAKAPVPALKPVDDTAAVAGSGGTGADEIAITPVPDQPETEVASADAAADTEEPLPLAEPEPPAPEPEAAVKTPPAPVAKPAPKPVVATGGNKGPIDLTPGTSARAPGTETEVAALPAGGMLVQVSSQRSEDGARSTFRELQGRFPSILGSYSPNIQRADLGAKGVYYRVRVGPFASGDAQRLCDALKSAGGDCVLARR